ncbi:MAG: argininosuccinate lyase [Proteobacteria bacterium]|nr:argininosuccinate lyase [Pseudomonadota bacterium]
MGARKINNKINIEAKVANDDTVSAVRSGTSASVWGYHFDEGYNKLVRNSLTSKKDIRLWALAIYSMQAQVRMLAKRSIVPDEISKQVIESLDIIKRQLTEGEAKIDSSYASVYEYIQSRLYEMLGDKADYAKVARSHDDQIVGDMKLWVREACDSLESGIRNLISALVHKAEENVKTNMPIDSQKSDIPVSLAHVLMSYVDAFGRDVARIKDARSRANVSPYSSSIAGTAFEINRSMVGKFLGFDEITTNSVDSVMDRDFIVEFLSVVSICATHLARMAQDLLNWSASGTRFIEFPGDFVKQHPILVNRRDAEVIEMVRSKTGSVYGSLINALTVLKGLPTGTSYDFTEMMEPAFDAYDATQNSLNIIAAIVTNFIVNRKNMKEAAQAEYSTAPDLTSWLIINLGMTVRDAEKTTRAIVDLAIARGKKLSLLELEELQSVDSRISDDIYGVLIPSRAVISRRSVGGSNPVQVRKAIRAARRRYL